MGVEGLWKIFEPFADRQSFAKLLTSDALERARDGRGFPVIGIDASPLMCQAQGAARRARENGASWTRVGLNVEYGCLVKFLEQWVRIPAIPLVVFDGDERPMEKRNRRVRGQEHYLARRFRALIEAFGFHAFTAPGEAEAELAYLNKAGHIDYVLTSDCDAFLFGAVKIIRCPQLEEDRDLVEVYDANALVRHEPWAFTRNGMIFLAMLSGGDYCTKGLEGCGLVTAFTLAQWTDLPDMLSSAVADAGPALSKWREKLGFELANNQHLRYKLRFLSSHIPETFPNPNVFNLYQNPVTSFSRPAQVLPDLGLKYPNSTHIVRLACELLDWKWNRIFRLLQTSVWPGHCMRQTIEEKKSGAAIPFGLSTQSSGLGRQAIRTIRKIDRLFSQPGSSASFQYFGLEISISSVQIPALGAYTSATSCGADPGEATRTLSQIWIPGPILRYVHPEIIQKYERKSPVKSNQNGACTSKKTVQNIIDFTAGDGSSPIHYSVTEEPNVPPTIEIMD
ncbi:hypothetical protein EST38_g13884 [Candolleomyces aberdarensis]|uniref:XPG-I domain-containing protein n=1 Tax=Candolleomyces aberdarensis TaxID=2316362 RepID=A0A4Q2CYV7_9AGAR|nr:hypothetical protein EST38_g13884 [Candolleomyces aberdarensis]